MREHLLEIRGLEVQYITDKDVVRAVNGISLTLDKGQILGLVGETGAGKTTTALSILQLIPKYTVRIPSGEIIFDGEDLLKKSEKEMCSVRGERISMIFQDPMTSLSPVSKVGSQIADVIRLHNPGMNRRQVNEKVEEILTRVGIPPERKKEYPHQFSGGMKQRIMIAIAIACRPDLLIADEPTTALDVTIQAQVIKMMRELQKELNSSVILITHDLGLVANFCDSVAIMYAGKIVEKGLLEDIFDRNRKHHPYTVGLFNSIPDLEGGQERLKSIPGLMPNPSELPQGCSFNPRCASCMDKCMSGNVPVYREGSHEIVCHLMGENRND